MKRRPKAAGSPQNFDQTEVASKIGEINSLTLEVLRVLWCAEFRREPPKGLSRDLLVRTLAWRLQEKAFGGHDKATRALLDAYLSGTSPAGALLCRLRQADSSASRNLPTLRCQAVFCVN